MELFKEFALSWSPMFLIGLVLLDMLRRSIFETGYSPKEDALSVLSAVGAKLSSYIMPVWLLHELPTRFAWDYGLGTIPVNFWTLALLLVLCDLAYYWEHRACHGIRWFWAAHEVHHTAKRVTMATGIRISWLRVPLLMVVFRLPLVWIGFDPTWVSVMSVVVGIFQVVVHDEKFPKIGWFDAVFVSPSNHRTHHFNDWRIDRNFGGMFIVWDRIFGTFAAEPDGNDHSKYGLKYWKDTSNPFVMNLSGIYGMFLDVARSRDMKSALMHVFGRPGWSPGKTEIGHRLPSSPR